MNDEKKIGIVRGPGSFQVQVDLPGAYQVSVLDASGRTLHSVSASGPGRTKLPEMKSGSYVIRVTSDKQNWTKSYSF